MSIIKKGNRCFDVFSGREVGCVQQPLAQTLGQTVPTPGVTPPPPPPPTPPTPPGGTGCCLNAACRYGCADLQSIYNCIVGYKSPLVPAGTPIAGIGLDDVVNIYASVSCNTIFNFIKSQYGTITGGITMQYTEIPGVFIDYIKFEGSLNPACSSIYMAGKWEYVTVGNKSYVELVGIKFCKNFVNNITDYDNCMDCVLYPPPPCTPLTTVTITPLHWRDSLNNLKSYPIDELMTYVQASFNLVVDKSPCAIAGPITLRQGTNCNAAIAPFLSTSITPPYYPFTMSFTIRFMWDFNCPSTPCPGPHPNAMYEILVTTPDSPIPVPTMINIPLGNC